jgi:pimeloyl-ACP methyl ester carboxylesterase
MVPLMAKLLFLPGAGGSAHFWRPVAEQLRVGDAAHFFSWPGLGDEPHDPCVRGLEDLVGMVLARMSEPVDLLAQSMGALVALKAAIAAPERVRRLVLTATSGGVPVDDLGGAEWRPAYRAEFPAAARWITEVGEDLSAQLGLIEASTLLLWGDQDPISPVAVGERLRELLPNGTLSVVAGGGHDFVRSHTGLIAPLIAEHLR